MLTGILFLLPALALVAVLLVRRYPGERTLTRLGAARRTTRWARPRASVPSGGFRGFTVAPHGGQLIARALAVRPPPAPLAAS